MGKITDRHCKNAKAEEGKDVFLNDGGGLYLRVRPGDSSAKVWLFRFKRLTGNGSRWFDIGTYPNIGLADARTIAAELAAKRRAGIDPINEKQAKEEASRREEEIRHQAKATHAARMTVKQMFERWEALELIQRKDKGASARRAFEKDILPFIGEMAAADVKKGAITECLYRVVERGSLSMARHLCADVKQFFSFGEDASFIEFDPAVKLDPDKFGKKNERTRHLNEAEIKALMKQLPPSGVKPQNQAALWITLATCCRIGEIIKAEWRHVDLDAGIWRIPADNAKNDNAFTIYISEFAKGKFRILKEYSNESAYVLPAKNRKSAVPHVCEKSITKQVGDRQLKEGENPMKNRCKLEQAKSLVIGDENWTPHDLRRSGTTLMVALGVKSDIAKLAGNHVEKDAMKRIYIQHEYAAELKEAWRLLGERLALLADVEGTNNAHECNKEAAGESKII